MKLTNEQKRKIYNESRSSEWGSACLFYIKYGSMFNAGMYAKKASHYAFLARPDLRESPPKTGE